MALKLANKKMMRQESIKTIGIVDDGRIDEFALDPYDSVFITDRLWSRLKVLGAYEVATQQHEDHQALGKTSGSAVAPVKTLMRLNMDFSDHRQCHKIVANAMKLDGITDEEIVFISKQWTEDHGMSNLLLQSGTWEGSSKTMFYSISVAPVAVVPLNRVILSVTGNDGWNSVMDDAETIKTMLMKRHSIVRQGDTVQYSHPSLDSVKLRVVSAQPVLQGSVAAQTVVCIARLSETGLFDQQLTPEYASYTPMDNSLLFDPVFDAETSVMKLDWMNVSGSFILRRREASVLYGCQSNHEFGPEGSRNESRLCFASLRFMVENGVKNGDWISIRAPNNSNTCKRLVKIMTDERIVESHVMEVDALLFRNTTFSETPECEAHVSISIPFDIYPIVPKTCLEVTLARVSTAASNNSSIFQEALNLIASQFKYQSRLVQKGDWIGVAVDEQMAFMKKYLIEEFKSLSYDIQTSFPNLKQACWFEVTHISVDGDLTDDAVVLLDPSKTKIIQSGVAYSKTPSYLLGPVNSMKQDCFQDLYEICWAYSQQFDSGTDKPLASVLVHGVSGSGKAYIVREVTKALSLQLIDYNAFDLLQDSMVKSQAHIELLIEKAAACAPSIVLLRHVEALSPKSDSQSSVSIVEAKTMICNMLDTFRRLEKPIIFVSTTPDIDAIDDSIKRLFCHELQIRMPSKEDRESMLRFLVDDLPLYPDLQLEELALHSAGFTPRNISNLVFQSSLEAVQRVKTSLNGSLEQDFDLETARIGLAHRDVSVALEAARTAHSDMIGVPKIPNVQWEDIGGLEYVKDTILETIRLPLDHPELFACGVKKRSGILLYGPPGTGKTLIAKAVATTLSLNFFSVKGPELLNMYIGESEANIRRVFQRARDARPCVIFFDELDSIAPKRGQKGDSGGVMDRIVSQLLAELDGMSEQNGNSDVFVIAATNRPDLLEPALLRPGRFDVLLYLGISKDHTAQYKVLKALTRKFQLDPELDLMRVAEQCPYNYTGADLYALCSDAMLKAITRKITEIESSSGNDETEMKLEVKQEDFELALKELVPSVSFEELERYERLQSEFQKPNLENT